MIPSLTEYRLSEVQRVLVTRLRWLGDVVMSTPMLAALRQALPAASIEYLTYGEFAPALQGHPAIDRIHTIPAAAGMVETLRAAARLRRPRFDWCFDTLGNPRSALLVRLIRPRHSVTPYRGPRSHFYEHQVVHSHGERSAVRHQLDSLAPLLGWVDERRPEIYVSPQERLAAAERLDLRGDAPLLIIHPGATRPERAWPLDRWPHLIGELQRSYGNPPVRVVTQPGWERRVADVAARCSGDVESLPVLDLRTLIALVADAALYVGNDGGILHCAVALKVPSVGIMGPTEDDVWFPYARWGPYRVVRGPSQPIVAEFPDASVAEVLAEVETVRGRDRA